MPTRLQCYKKWWKSIWKTPERANLGSAYCSPSPPLPLYPEFSLYSMSQHLDVLKSWHKNPNPCRHYNTRHTCTISDTWLHNSQPEHTCPLVCTVVSTPQEGGGHVTGGGEEPRLPCNIHASSEYQFHVLYNVFVDMFKETKIVITMPKIAAKKYTKTCPSDKLIILTKWRHCVL